MSLNGMTNRRVRSAIVLLLVCTMTRGAAAQGGPADLTRLPIET